MADIFDQMAIRQRQQKPDVFDTFAAEEEARPFFDITRMEDRPTMSLAGTAPDDPTKTLWEAVRHGWKRAGIQAKTGLAGMMQAEVELDLMPSPMFMGDLKMSSTEKKALKEWSTSTIEKADQYYEEHPEEAMQLEEDAGFLATTWDVVSHPEKMLQGIVEAIPLMAEAAIGTVVAGPVGGIAVMAQPIVGNTYQTARKKGTDPFPAFMQATLTGYGEAAIEQWTFGKKIGLAQGIGKIVKEGGKRILWEGTKLYVRGTVEEGSQKFNENLWNWVFTDRSQILTEGVMQAAAVGGPLETVMGGAFAGGGIMLSKGKTVSIVPNSEKIRRVEALRNRANESSLSDDEKVEVNKAFDQTVADINDGKFDSGPVDVEVKKVMSFKEWQDFKNPFAYGETNAEVFGVLENQKQHYKWYTEDRAMIPAASPAAQIDAAETVITGQEALLDESNKRQAARYDELIELVQQGDELAAKEIQEMTMGGPLTEEQQKEYDDLLKKVQEGDEDAAQQIQELTTDEQNAERNLPAYEVLFEAMMEGDEAAATALLNGEYKGARAAIAELEPPPTEIKGEEIISAGFRDIKTGKMFDTGAIHDRSQLPPGPEAQLATERIFITNTGRALTPTEAAELTKLKSQDMLTANNVIGLGVQSEFRPKEQVSPIIAQPSTEVYRGKTRVDSTLPATDEQTRNFATIKVHSLARLLGLKKKDRQQIQFDLIGQKSLKGMSVAEVKKVEDYFVAQAKELGLSTSTGKELAESIKRNSTQKAVVEMSGIKPATWKRILQTPGRVLNQFLYQSKRIERLLEALDGFTEGPIYNSIWKVTQTQLVNSRTSHNERVARFREALVDIMTPELQTDEGIAEASDMIKAEDEVAGRKARKMSKRAIRKLVGDSLWAKYITGGKTLIAEAAEGNPEIRLSAAERIGAYLAMKNENSLIHLREGNLSAYANSDMAIIQIVEAMSSQEKEIGNWILRDLEANFERADGAAKLGLNRNLEPQDNYFPMRIIDVTDLQREDFLTLLEDKPQRPSRKIEPGEVKARQKGANRPIDLDSFSVYLNHLTRIEQFIHMAPVAKSVGKILNTKEFRQALNDVTAGHGIGLLDRWLRNSIKGHAIEHTTNIMAKAMLWSRTKGVLYALSGNLPSVARQFISGFNAVASHPTVLAYSIKYMAEAADPRFYNMLERRMLEKSDVIKTRSFERELANVKHQAQAARVLTGKKEFSEKALAWQKWADRRTVTIAWNSFYDSALNSESVQKQFDLDESEEAAVAFSNKMVARTQPMGDVEHLPDLFTGGTVARLISTFQNQVNNNWNFWAHDIYGMRKHGKISNKMVMYRVLFSHILPSMMFGAISRGGLPDDWGDVLFDSVVYSLGPLMLAGRLITDAMLGFGGGKTSVEDILPTNFSKTVQAILKGEPKQAAIPALKTVGGLTGRVPNQAIRTGQGVYDLWTGETEDLRRLVYSDWSLTNYGWPGGKDEGRESIER